MGELFLTRQEVVRRAAGHAWGGIGNTDVEGCLGLVWVGDALLQV